MSLSPRSIIPAPSHSSLALPSSLAISLIITNSAIPPPTHSASKGGGTLSVSHAATPPTRLTLAVARRRRVRACGHDGTQSAGRATMPRVCSAYHLPQPNRDNEEGICRGLESEIVPTKHLWPRSTRRMSSASPTPGRTGTPRDDQLPLSSTTHWASDDQPRADLVQRQTRMQTGGPPSRAHTTCRPPPNDSVDSGAAGYEGRALLFPACRSSFIPIMRS